MRRHLNAFAAALALVALTLGAIEIMLRVIDPWGIVYFDDLYAMYSAIEVDETRGYILPDGDYTFSHWQARMVDGTRHIPATNPAAACKLVILGDSTAFGHGVDDDQAWPNHVARALPDVHIINAALTGYNSTNAWGSLRAFPDGDATLYITIGNDLQPALDFRTQRPAPPFTNAWILRYTSFARTLAQPPANAHQPDDASPPQAGTNAGGSPPIPDGWQRYLADVAAMADLAEHFRIYAADDLRPVLAAHGYDVLPIPPGGGVISRADQHQNPAGNIIRAENMLATLPDLLARACP